MTSTPTAAFGIKPHVGPSAICEKVARTFLILFAAIFLLAHPDSASASTDGPVVHIVSPVDGQAVAGGLLSVVVEFSAKLNFKGQPSGNVTHVDLLVNGHVVAVYQNPPNVKSGTHTFVVDLSQFGSGPIQLSAIAYQGEGSSAPSESSSGVTVQIDTVPPDITGATPANGSLGISGSVEVRADLFDAGSGIDSPATRLTLDGADVTASSTRTTSRVSYMAAGLLDGPHAAKVDTADRAGNPAHLEWGFLLDLTDPFDAFTQPAEDVTVSTGRPMLTLSYSDPTANGFASGVDLANIQWFEDGRDVTSEAVIGADSATYTPPADRPLSEGEHHYLAIVHDRAGRSHSAERTITVHVAPPPSVAIVLPGAITPLYAPQFLFTFSGTAPVTPTFARINGVDVLDRFQVTDTFAGYIPEVGDPVFLHAGTNLFEVGVVDGLGVAASASKIIGLVSGPGPATVPLVLTLKTGIALHALSHRPTPLIELVAQAGLGGAAVPGVALSAEFPGGFVQLAPPLSLNTSDLGFAGLYCVPGALTGTENSEVVHLTIRAKDYPDATPLDVPVTVYRPTLEVSFSVPEHSEDSAQVFDDKIAVGASSHLVSARLTGAGVSGAETAVRFEIGRGTGADFVPDATLGEWMPEEVLREMGAECNSSLFVLAPADAATVRISAPEFPESGVKEYSVTLVAKRERVIDVSTALPEGGFADTFPTVPIGSPFKSGNGQIVVHNGALGTPLVLDLRGYNAALRDTGAGAPYFSIYYTLLGPGHALPSSPYDWAMHVDSLGADEVSLPILPSVSFEPAQMLLLYIIGSTADNGSGVFASIEAWEVGNLGPAEVRLVHIDSITGVFVQDVIPVPDPIDFDLASVPAYHGHRVEVRLPSNEAASSLNADLIAVDETFSPILEDGNVPPHSRHPALLPVESTARYTIYRSDAHYAFSRAPSEYPPELSGDPAFQPEYAAPEINLGETAIRIPAIEQATVSYQGTQVLSRVWQGGRLLHPLPRTASTPPVVNKKVNLCSGEIEFVQDNLAGTGTWRQNPGVRLTFTASRKDRSIVLVEFDGDVSPSTKHYDLLDFLATVFVNPAPIPAGKTFDEYIMRVQTSRDDTRAAIDEYGTEPIKTHATRELKRVTLKAHVSSLQRGSMKESRILQDLRLVNEIWRQAGIEFSYAMKSDGHIDIDFLTNASMNSMKDGSDPHDPENNLSKFDTVRDAFPGVLNVFFVEHIVTSAINPGLSIHIPDDLSQTNFANRYSGIAPLSTAVDRAKAISHEFGHVLLGLATHVDQNHPTHEADKVIPLLENLMHSKLERSASTMVEYQVRISRESPYAR